MNKKGYMFILDATIAIIILIIGVAVLFYKFAPSNETIYYTEQLSEDVIGVLFYTNIKDLCTNPGVSGLCECRNYPKLQNIVCYYPPLIYDFDASLLSMISEIIETGTFNSNDIEEIIREIFVTNNVIDEKRFGFAVLYTDMWSLVPLELYNTETYTP